MKRPSIRLQLEQLEDRLAPAAFTVTTTADNGNMFNPTPNSLRAAIIAVDGGKDNAIDFNIGVGNQIIKLTNIRLPRITKPVTIDGSTKVGQTIEIDRAITQRPTGTVLSSPLARTVARFSDSPLTDSRVVMGSSWTVCPRSLSGRK